jgi:hypothetical protein
MLCPFANIREIKRAFKENGKACFTDKTSNDLTT